MDQEAIQVVSKVAVNALTEIFKSCYQGLTSAREWLIDQNKEHDFFGTAARNYIEKLLKRYGTVRIMGMANPVPLSQIYTRVNILEKITAQQRETREELERTFDKDRRRFGNIRRTKSGIAVVNERKNFILLGKPGAGKTTFLKHIAMVAAGGLLAQARIPIFVELKQLSDSEMQLMDFLVEQFEICNFPDAKGFIERALAEGNCIVLFDGLDEVAKSEEDGIIRQIENLTDKFDKNHFIISCRIAAYTYCFEHFSDVEIADFDEAQTKTFVYNWFDDDSTTAKACWRQMDGSPPIKELGKTPLLLTLLCLAFDENLHFPSNRADLYRDAIEALLKKWDASRRVKRDEVYRSLSSARKENMLARIAADSFAKDQYFFYERELEAQISDFIANLSDVTEATIENDSKAVLKCIEAQHGLLVERARGIYSFSHLTLQEFFTGRYIIDNARNGTLEKLISQHLTDAKWREVFLIIAGLLPNANDFLVMIDQAIKSRMPIAISSLVEEQRELVSDLHLTSKYPSVHPTFARSVLLENVCASGSRGEWMSNVGLLTEKVYGLLEGNRSFEPQINDYFNKDSDYVDCRHRLEAHPRFALAIRNTKFDDTAQGLTEYLRATMILLDCLFTGCYVNKEIKKRILDRLFTTIEC